MKSLLFLALVAAVCAWEDPFTYEESQLVVPNEWIVIFQDSIADEDRLAHMKVVALMDNTTVKHEWTIGEFSGYSMKTTDEIVQRLSKRDEVKYVEANQRSFLSTEAEPVYNVFEPNEACLQQNQVPSWGLTRSQERVRTLNGIYRHADDAGAGVVGYVIDTGIFVEHPDFEGRAVWGVDTADNPPVFQDANGHGTHCAGTMIAAKYGLARSGTAIAVKVLGANGSGTNDGVIAGINWAVRDHKTRGTGRSVANMSLGGGFSQAMNNAVAAAVNQGLAMAVAAGNDGRGIIPSPDACKHSPASEKLAITVGATDSTDFRADYSNYGSCVKIFAPGSAITSTWKRTPGQAAPINTISGTSMACPHVAGVLMKLWSAHPNLSRDELTDLLLASTTDGVVKDPKAGSPNKLVFESCSGL